VVTLFIVVPIMLTAMFYVRRGSKKAQLFWLGFGDLQVMTQALPGSIGGQSRPAARLSAPIACLA